MLRTMADWIVGPNAALVARHADAATAARERTGSALEAVLGEIEALLPGDR